MYISINTIQKTLEHKTRVGDLLGEVNKELFSRAIHHDDSKFSNEELPLFDKYTSQLANLTYGSEEYKDCLKQLGPALEHHYQNNSHHPEYHNNDLSFMTLLDIIEMLADWKAATERHHNGNIMRSIEINQDRWGYSDELKNILVRTVQSLGWDK